MRTAKRVIMGIATLAILFGVTMLVMQFCTPYKPSNGFKKAETATQTVATTNEVRLAENSPTYKTFTATNTAGFNVAGSNFKTWYNQAPTGMHSWEYVIKANYTCTGSGCSNKAVAFYLELYVETDDGYQDKTLEIKPDKFSETSGSNAVSGVSFSYNHTHSRSADTDYVIVSITQSKMTISVEDIVTHSVSTVYSCNKGDAKYTFYYKMLTGAVGDGYGMKIRLSDLSGYSEHIQQSMTLDARVPVSLPANPTKEGYTFTGWYFDEACTQAYDGRQIYADTVLYAGWRINTFTVTYDANGGSACESVTVNWNTAPTLPTPTRIGYTFLGWFDGDTQYTDAPVKENKTLTAHWEILTFTVTFMSDGEVYKTMTVEYGTSLQAAMQTANLTYMHALNEQKQVISKSTPITEDVTVPIGEMTAEEKVATFIGNNWWLLAVGGAVHVAMAGVIAILSVMLKKRG